MPTVNRTLPSPPRTRATGSAPLSPDRSAPEAPFDRFWSQVLVRDATASFVYAVRSTGIFCRPCCPSRRPLLANVAFFLRAEDALAGGYRPCLRCRPMEEDGARRAVLRLCRHLARNRHRTVPLAELGRLLHLSPYTAQKKFVRAMGLSPRQYQLQLRTDDLRRRLQGGQATVTDAIYEAGYGAASRFYEHAPEHLGMSAVSFRNGGRGRSIRFAIAPCPLGEVLLAATELGVCSVMLGDDSCRLEAQLRDQFPNAAIAADPQGLAGHLGVVLQLCEARPGEQDLPLDLRATSFQARVWKALREIPCGETRSYAELARIVGQPAAARAVARACASNPVAILIPCHRVVGGDGSLTGYRWGLERKKALLELERRPRP